MIWKLNKVVLICTQKQDSKHVWPILVPNLRFMNYKSELGYENAMVDIEMKSV